MNWIKNNYAKLAAVCVIALLAGCAIWGSMPAYPKSSSDSGAAVQKTTNDDAAVAREANHLASQANVISYKQGVAASIGAITGVLTLLSAIAAAIYAKAAAGESRRSADIAQQALVAGERAWVSVHVTPDGPLQFSPHGGLSLRIAINIKNIGKTPALNVHTDVDEIHLDLDTKPERMKYFSDSKRVDNTSASRVLLPDQEYTRAWVPGAEGATDEFPLFPVIIGCVTYQIAPDRTLHQTSFALMLIKKDDVGLLLYRPGNEVPQDELDFTHVAGAFAD